MSRLLDLILLLTLLLGWPVWRRKPRDDWAGRWGKGESLPPRVGPRVAIHAVSVGEVNAALPLIRRLATRLAPDQGDIVLSVTTDTGFSLATSLFPDPDTGPSGSTKTVPVRVVRHPIDASWAIKRWLDRTDPTTFALVELEVWPNTLIAMRRRRIPAVVVNGRMSDRSFIGYTRFRFAVAWMFQLLEAVGAQSEKDAERFRALGCRVVSTIGTIKWDAAKDDAARIHLASPSPEQLAEALGLDLQRPVVVLGSAAPNECALVRTALEPLDSVQLLAAPRKPEWFDKAAEELGPTALRRTARTTAPAGARWFLLDTIGELPAAYAIADIAVIGRSFAPLYGSDVMQPAALGVPMVVGPNTADFSDAVRKLRDANALITCEQHSLKGVLRDLLGSPDTRQRMKHAALAAVDRNAGAAERYADLALKHGKSIPERAE